MNCSVMYSFVHSLTIFLKSYYFSHITPFIKMYGKLIQILRMNCSVLYLFVHSLTIFLKSYYFSHITPFIKRYEKLIQILSYLSKSGIEV